MFARTCGSLKDRCAIRCSVPLPSCDAKGDARKAYPAPPTTGAMTRALSAAFTTCAAHSRAKARSASQRQTRESRRAPTPDSPPWVPAFAGTSGERGEPACNRPHSPNAITATASRDARTGSANSIACGGCARAPPAGAHKAAAATD